MKYSTNVQNSHPVEYKMIEETMGNEESNSFKINNPKNKEVPIIMHLYK
jgi:hypothetical protein